MTRITLERSETLQVRKQLYDLAVRLGVQTNGSQPVGTDGRVQWALSIRDNKLMDTDSVGKYCNKYEFISHLYTESGKDRSQFNDLGKVMGFSFGGTPQELQELMLIGKQLGLPIYSEHQGHEVTWPAKHETIVYEGGVLQGHGYPYGDNVSKQEFIDRMLKMVGVVPTSSITAEAVKPLKQWDVVTIKHGTPGPLGNAVIGMPYVIESCDGRTARLSQVTVAFDLDKLILYPGLLNRDARENDTVIRIRGSNNNIQSGDIATVTSNNLGYSGVEAIVRKSEKRTIGNDRCNLIAITLPDDVTPMDQAKPEVTIAKHRIDDNVIAYTVINVGDVIIANQNIDGFIKDHLYVVSESKADCIKAMLGDVSKQVNRFSFNKVLDLDKMGTIRKDSSSPPRIGLRIAGINAGMKMGYFDTYTRLRESSLKYGSGQDVHERIVDVTGLVLPEQYQSPIPGLNKGSAVARTATTTTPIPNTNPNGQLQNTSFTNGRSAEGRAVQRPDARRQSAIGSRHPGYGQTNPRIEAKGRKGTVSGAVPSLRSA